MTENVMKDPRRSLHPNLRLQTLLAWGIPAFIILAALLVWLLPRLANPVASENAPIPASPAIEEKYGVRISMLAVTADGGMVDLRYVVLDPVKAQTFGTTPDTTPQLYPVSGALVFNTAPMPHKDVIHAGTTYFLLYHNDGAAIKSQTFVTVVLGGIKLERVPVR